MGQDDEQTAPASPPRRVVKHSSADDVSKTAALLHPHQKRRIVDPIDSQNAAPDTAAAIVNPTTASGSDSAEPAPTRPTVEPDTYDAVGIFDEIVKIGDTRQLIKEQVRKCKEFFKREGINPKSILSEEFTGASDFVSNDCRLPLPVRPDACPEEGSSCAASVAVVPFVGEDGRRYVVPSLAADGTPHVNYAAQAGAHTWRH